MTVEEKYGVANTTYRILKEIAISNTDLKLLDNQLKYYSNLLKDKNIKVGSIECNKLTDLIDEINVSRTKKRNKLKLLEKELD